MPPYDYERDEDDAGLVWTRSDTIALAAIQRGENPWEPREVSAADDYPDWRFPFIIGMLGGALYMSLLVLLVFVV